MCVCVCVFVCEMEVGVEQEGLEECQDHSLSFGQKEQSGTRRQGFLCVSLVPQRLRKTGPQLTPKYILWIWCKFLLSDPPEAEQASLWACCGHRWPLAVDAPSITHPHCQPRLNYYHFLHFPELDTVTRETTPVPGVSQPC